MGTFSQRSVGIVALFLLVGLLIGCSKESSSTANNSGGSVVPSGASSNAPRPVGSKAGGALDRADTASVAGWAWDPDQPDTPIKVTIYDGDIALGTILADKPRTDLQKAGKGNGNHAFVFKFPEPIKDKQPHVIGVSIAETGVKLKNSPKVVRVNPDDAADKSAKKKTTDGKSGK
jgi:hypothetical protein